MKFLGKRGVGIADMPSYAIYIVIGFVVLALGGTMMSAVQTGQTAGSAAYNISGYGLTTLLNMGTNLPVLGTVIALVIILGVLIGVLVVGRKQ